MHLLGADVNPKEKLIVMIIALTLDVFLLKLWRVTYRLPTLSRREYTPKEKKAMSHIAWFTAWILAMVFIFKYD